MPGLVVGLTCLTWLTLLLCAPASAAELLKNGNFELPLGPTNWTVGYLHGGPDDWEIKDRSRGGPLHGAYGGYFRVLSLKLPHVYFTQSVSNLTAGYAYKFVGHMKEDWWKLGDENRDQYKVYIELIGGQGNPLESCGTSRCSVLATNDLTNSAGDPEPNINPPYTYPTDIWRPFYAEQTPDAEGKIEVGLHYDKCGFSIYDKLWISAGSFDDCSLTP